MSVYGCVSKSSPVPRVWGGIWVRDGSDADVRFWSDPSLPVLLGVCYLSRQTLHPTGSLYSRMSPCPRRPPWAPPRSDPHLQFKVLKCAACAPPQQPPSPSPASNRHHTRRRVIVMWSQGGRKQPAWERQQQQQPVPGEERSCWVSTSASSRAASGTFHSPCAKSCRDSGGEGGPQQHPPGCEAAGCFRNPSATAQTALQTVIESTIWLQRRDGALASPQMSTFQDVVGGRGSSEQFFS